MPRYFILLFTICIAVSAAAESLSFGDAKRGEKLHAANCQGCHDTGVYTRPDRKIKTVEGLAQRVDMCNQNLRRNLGKDQREDLVEFLDSAYYRFQ